MNKYWIVAPIIPSESIIQNKTREPTKGVTIIGNIVAKIDGPLIFCDKEFMEIAIIKPKHITKGVTKNVYVNVKINGKETTSFWNDR